MMGINEEDKREWHDKQARKERRRVERRHTPLGRFLNILGF
ncbi:MAG: hypothetical protein OXC99_10545 [Chloroflexi bacterium]|nr:hypothetical protein [Chloroflexota bacterium]